MKATFRNFRITLLRFRLASILNILGLSTAFAAFIIIMIQVRYEHTFDTSYKKSGRIYRVESTLVPTESDLSLKETYTAFCARPLIEMLLPSIPRIESYSIMYGGSSEIYAKYDTAEGEPRGMMIPFRKVSDGFIEVFDAEITEGTARSLSEPGKALLPESLARKMFGQSSPIGRQITLSDGTFFTVGAVYKDFPENTSLVNDIKISLTDEYKNDWTDWAFFLFVALPPDTSSDEVAKQLANFFGKTGMGKQMGFTQPVSFRLNPIEDIYYRHDTSLDFAPKGNRLITNILLSIALLIIAIAAINFLNFSAALTPARIKSINIRKVLGESTSKLRCVLIFEAMGICLLSFLLALCWVWIFHKTGLSSILLTPADLLKNADVVLLTLLLAGVVGIGTGIYPAFYMTSFRPVLVLKGAFGMSPAGRKLRVALTGFQFLISIGLITSAFFIWLQNNYMYHKENILNKDQIATVTLDKEIISRQGEVLFEKLKSVPSITGVTCSDWPVGFLDYYLYTYSKSPNNEDIMYYFIPVSYNFADIMGLDIVGGRNFDKTDETTPEEKLILNELAARQFNVKPGDKLANGSQVIGIVKDFHFMNLRKKIEPMALSSKQFQSPILHPTLYMRTTGNAHSAIEQIKACIATIDPLYPVEVKFYDQQFEQAYRKERNTSAQITLFSLLAIIISLMGVFGLVTFETQYRRKEISIRKIMGATVTEILIIFYKKFAWIMIVCFLLVVPIVWYGVNKWLAAFTYRTPLHWWIFILSLLIVMVITFITVTLQSWQVATSNPVHSLKSE